MMSHFAKVVDGTVTQVIVAEQDFFNTFRDTSPGTWIQTSYNTRGNVHYNPITNLPDGGTPLRGNYAGPGYIYDKTHDVFYPPKRFPSWHLNQDTWLWEPPTPEPKDGVNHYWDEPSLSWKPVLVPPRPE